jgi:plastocyanin
MRHLLFLLCLLPLATGVTSGPNPAPEEAATLFGTVTLKTSRGTVPGARSVVWLPDVPEGDHPGREETIVSRGKRFEPHVLGVEAGERVSFPNLDPVYHNVFSLSGPNSFDLGLYRRGAVPSVQFHTPGLVRIYCNIHPDMAAYVVVLDGAAFAVTGADGSFRIPGVPPGHHPVKVWNERGGELDAALDVEPGRDKEYSPTLDASAYRPAPHKNKHGRDYPPNDDRY